MEVAANTLRAGHVIDHENKLWVIIRSEIMIPGKGNAIVQIDMRDARRAPVEFGTSQPDQAGKVEPPERFDGGRVTGLETVEPGAYGTFAGGHREALSVVPASGGMGQLYRQDWRGTTEGVSPLRRQSGQEIVGGIASGDG